MKDVLIALAGNQNCGKTTLFNRLTGSNQHVGNFPGVTVEKKMGQIKSFKEAALVDLPGIYPLSPYTSEEVVTRDFILKDDPDLIINIVAVSYTHLLLIQKYGIDDDWVDTLSKQQLDDVVIQILDCATYDALKEKMEKNKSE